MMPGSIITIVEGYSEVEAVPILLRRLLDRIQCYGLKPATPYRVHRNKVVKPGELEKAITQATRDRPNPACVMVILDADDDDPEALRAQLLERCRIVTALPCAVVVPRHEFEAWFLGAKESLRGCHGIKPDAASPADPESIRAAKSRLTDNMTGSMAYHETTHQPAFAEQFDLETAKEHCPSLARMIDEFERVAREAMERLERS
jgi:hypothetical protein